MNTRCADKFKQAKYNMNKARTHRKRRKWSAVATYWFDKAVSTNGQAIPGTFKARPFPSFGL